MYFDKRMIYAIIAIMVIWGILKYLIDINSLLGLL